MKHALIAVIIIISCILFAGYSYAVVAHPENANIVGGVFDSHSICFNNDGNVFTKFECDLSAADEGALGVGGNWVADNISEINACEVFAVNPVSSATCTRTYTDFAPCTGNEFVLVQTTKSGHYWAVKANADCTAIATPETTGLVPCLSTDGFDPELGCYDPIPPEITIKNGFLRTDSKTLPPLDLHCGDPTHVGRMVVDGANDIIYVCTPTGWSTH